MNTCMNIFIYAYIYIYIYIYKNEALSRMCTGFFWHEFKASLLWRLRLSAEPFPPCPINTGVFVGWMQSFWNMHIGFFLLSVCIAMCFHMYACACAFIYMHVHVLVDSCSPCHIHIGHYVWSVEWVFDIHLELLACLYLCVCIYICMYTYRIYMHTCIGM